MALISEFKIGGFNVIQPEDIQDTDLVQIVRKGNFNRVTTFAGLATAIDALINPLSLVISDVISPYVVSDEDSGTFLIFNDAGTADIQIPNNLSKGVNFAYTNIGAGSVQLVYTGTDTLRGAALIVDPVGYAAVTKIGLTLWQTSER